MVVILPAFAQAQPEGIDVVQLSYLAWLESQENTRFDKYAMFRDYYEGEHDTALTKRTRKYLELSSEQEFSFNFCPIIVDALAEKLKIANFDCGTDKTLSDQVAEWWKFNRMDAQQGVVHTSAVRDGDTYILVEWDNESGMPLLTHEKAYDSVSQQGMHIIYSDERRMLPVVAVKRWTITSGVNIKTRRTNFYYPNRIEKYSDEGTGNTWQHYVEEGEEWPIPWTDTGRIGGKPLGIPAVHFRNKDQGYSYGESELEDVIPLANASNKVFIDLLGAADSTGFQMYTASGYDGSGRTVAPGVFLWSENPETKFGVLPPASLAALIELHDKITADAAKLTRTPLSFFQLTGQVAAAGTLKEQRAGLISKALDRQTTFGNSWEDAIAIARRLHNVWGTGKLDEATRVSTVWVDDEKPDPKALADEVAAATQAGAMSTDTKVRRLHPDWDEDKIAAEVKLIRDEMGMAVPDIGPVA